MQQTIMMDSSCLRQAESEVYETNLDSQGVHGRIIDTGMAFSHPGLYPKLARPRFVWPLRCEQQALAEQVELGAAIHGSLE
jgi:hypothetical protein